MVARSRSNVLRVIVAMQALFVFCIGGAIRGWGPTPPEPAGWSAAPTWVESLIGTAFIAIVYPLPVWGIVAAWWSKIRGWRFATVVAVELLLWYAAMIALLPAVQ